jgi:hypothetical protein
VGGVGNGLGDAEGRAESVGHLTRDVGSGVTVGNLAGGNDGLRGIGGGEDWVSVVAVTISTLRPSSWPFCSIEVSLRSIPGELVVLILLGSTTKPHKRIINQ